VLGDDVTQGIAAFDGEGHDGEFQGEGAQVEGRLEMDEQVLRVAFLFGLVAGKEEYHAAWRAFGDGVGFVRL
jgi:hypothetical protein